MTETTPKALIDRRLLPSGRVFGALAATTLAAVAPNHVQPAQQHSALESPPPLSQPAANQPRQSVEQFLVATRQKLYDQAQENKLPKAQPRMNIPVGAGEVGLQKLHPEKLLIPPTVSEIMRKNAVYIPELGCSGFLVRNQEDIPIGIITAEHCSLRLSDGHWFRIVSGETWVSFNHPIEVQTGDSMDDLTTVGEVTQFLLNAGDDTTHDEALGVFAGHTIEEVSDRYKEIALPKVSSLKPGDVVYNSGWPINQLNNPGPLKRQEFAMSTLGTAKWELTNGEKLNLLVAAVPISKDGAECSWGNSGSVAFKVDSSGKVWIIGVASAFNDFGHLFNKDNPQAAASERDYITSNFNVDMTGYGAVCGFSYEPPTLKGGAVVATVSINPQQSKS